MKYFLNILRNQNLNPKVFPETVWKNFPTEDWEKCILNKSSLFIAPESSNNCACTS